MVQVDAEGPPATRPTAPSRTAWSRGRFALAAVAAVLSAIASVGFIVAPVMVHQVTYSWDSIRDGAASGLPLLTGRPDRLELTVPCATADAASDVVLSTYPLDSADRSRGLVVRRNGAGIQVDSGGGGILATSLNAGCGAVQIALDASSAQLAVDGKQAAVAPGDRRPELVGFFLPEELAGSPAVSGSAIADNRFDSSPSALKVTLGLVAIGLLAALLALVVVADHGNGGRRRWRPWPSGRALRPRWGDAVVLVTLGGWAVVGPTTVDDGYIVTMVRNRAAAGFVGNYFRWFNSPEAPFGWFYELFALATRVSDSMAWLRLPSVALGLATWLLIDRALLPRFLSNARRLRTIRVAAVAVFLLWWLPYNSGLRPEPFIALGAALVLALVDRGTTMKRLAPIVLAGLIAGLTVAVGPTGIIAFAPFVAYGKRFGKQLARWSWRERVLGIAMVAAGSLLALLPMFADQSLATVLEATRVRELIGPNFPWQDEYIRYASLLDYRGSIEGSLTRRVPVLLAIAATGLVGAFAVARQPSGDISRRRAGLIVITCVTAAASIAFTPTKWTHHFGAFAAFGTVLTVMLVALATRRSHDDRVARGIATILVTIAIALSLDGYNKWWYLSGLGMPFGERVPSVGGIELSTAVLVVGAVAGFLQILVRSTKERRVLWPQLVTAALVTLLVFEVGSLAPAFRAREGTYSVSRAGVQSIAGDPCLLEDLVQVEPDRTRGALTAADDSGSVNGFTTPRDAAVDGALTSRAPNENAVPRDAATSQGTRPSTRAPTATTDWLTIPAAARQSRLPLVIAAAGRTSSSVTLTAEFRSSSAPTAVPRRLPITETSPELADTRIDVGAAYPTADQVRLVSTDDSTEPGAWVAFSAPRVPVTTTLRELNPPGTPTAVDWSSAFYLPCTTPAAVGGGIVAAPHYAVTSEGGLNGTASLGFSREAGGAYVPVAELNRLERLPSYLTGDILRDVVSVYRLQQRYSSTPGVISTADVLTGGLDPAPQIAVPGR